MSTKTKVAPAPLTYAANRLARRVAVVRAVAAVGRRADLGRRRRHGPRRRPPPALAANRRRQMAALGAAGRGVVAAIGIRAQLGYFLARDPCVQFLYVLVGIKFVESRNTRDGTLLICLALFLAVTQFFYTQTIVRHCLRCPPCSRSARALAALRASGGTARIWWTQLALPGPPDAAGHSAGDPCCLSCFPDSLGRYGVRRPTPARAPACRTACRPARSATCRVPTRSHSESTFTVARPNRATATGAVPYWRASTAGNGVAYSDCLAANSRNAKARLSTTP